MAKNYQILNFMVAMESSHWDASDGGLGGGGVKQLRESNICFCEGVVGGGGLGWG